MQTLAGALQAHKHVCVVFFVLVLHVVIAYSLKLYRGACLFLFSKFPLGGYALFPNRICHKLKEATSFQNQYIISICHSAASETDK